MKKLTEFEKQLMIFQLKFMAEKFEQSSKALEESDLTLSEFELSDNAKMAFKMLQFGIMQLSAASNQVVQSAKAAIDALEKM